MLQLAVHQDLFHLKLIRIGTVRRIHEIFRDVDCRIRKGRKYVLGEEGSEARGKETKPLFAQEYGGGLEDVSIDCHCYGRVQPIREILTCLIIDVLECGTSQQPKQP